MMSIFSCNLCPLTFATRGELASHEFIHHITPASASTTYQPNQGSTIAGSSSGVGGNPWQIDPFEVFNSAFSTGDEASLLQTLSIGCLEIEGTHLTTVNQYT